MKRDRRADGGDRDCAMLWDEGSVGLLGSGNGMEFEQRSMNNLMSATCLRRLFGM